VFVLPRLLAAWPLLTPILAIAEETSPGVGASTFLQALAALGLIVALLLATAWLAQRVSGGRGFGSSGMKVVAGLNLGPRERIVVVEVGETWLVIGIVPGQIRTLHTLPRGESPPVGHGAGERSFAHWLKQIAERPRA
jgi:flagellar protein FliO/FliZ